MITIVEAVGSELFHHGRVSEWVGSPVDQLSYPESILKLLSKICRVSKHVFPMVVEIILVDIC